MGAMQRKMGVSFQIPFAALSQPCTAGAVQTRQFAGRRVASAQRTAINAMAFSLRILFARFSRNQKLNLFYNCSIIGVFVIRASHLCVGKCYQNPVDAHLLLVAPVPATCP